MTPSENEPEILRSASTNSATARGHVEIFSFRNENNS